MKFKAKIIILFLIIGTGIAAAVWVVGLGSKTEGFKPVNTTAENAAVKGFDTVAYFTAQKAIEGNPKYEFVWNGAKWFFASAENLDLFKANPEKFAPQFGGYCSYAVSKGYTADGDPQAWKVVDGKLYLNYNQKVKEMWEAEQQQRIKDGERNWQEFQTKKPEHKG
jgi:YHS domain-containing protein